MSHRGVSYGYFYFNREIQERKHNNGLDICKNPHKIYYEEYEGETNDNDASIINRNILSNKSTDDEIYHEIKRVPRNASYSLYKLYGKERDKNNFLIDKNFSSNRNKGLNEQFNMNNSFKNFFYTNAKKSGFGY